MSKFKEKFKTYVSLFLTFFKIGLFSFGGGYGMIALIENEIVDRHKWLSHNELLDIIAISESTPGPISINIATFIGVQKLGIIGGITTSLGVILPSFLIIIALSYIIDLVKDNFWVACLFKGIRIGVLILISKSVFSFFKDMKKNILSLIFMIASFCVAFFTSISVIYIILVSIALGAIIVAISHYVSKRIYHSVGTNPYYSEYKYPDGNANDNVYRRITREEAEL